MLNLIDRASNRLVLNPKLDGRSNKVLIKSKSNLKTDYIPAISHRKELEHSSEAIEIRLN